MLSVNGGNNTIVIIKNFDYRCIIQNVSKSGANELLKISVLKDSGYLSKKISVYSSQFSMIFFTLFVLLYI